MQIISGPERTTYDVVVIGSGAAGLTAAATAANQGLRVLVLEKASLLGGTSAVSGGMLWVADNHLARAAGISDSLDAAATYVREISRGRGREELLTAAIQHGDEMLRFVQDELGIRFILLDNFPDYSQQLTGASQGGRTVEPALYNAAAGFALGTQLGFLLAGFAPTIGFALLGDGVNGWVPVAVFTAGCLLISAISAFTARETYRVPTVELGKRRSAVSQPVPVLVGTR
ncbi:FAD-dependent oxidoreductase [Lysinibacter cavernae]|uniref:FAD-dependent oxidoreductase 2 FAD-binding domain-containing protein n=1 Tax=Lysinibacter cavernae TaxID=1640652 RepID=A0A7X5R2A1_9MICO|nr:FAD-dependent oxidoreductase [Lysinibacter cavernae]NIH54177.1 hypothetical protein [Lysinibacter cavernae]